MRQYWLISIYVLATAFLCLIFRTAPAPTRPTRLIPRSRPRDGSGTEAKVPLNVISDMEKTLGNCPVVMKSDNINLGGGDRRLTFGPK